jgi:hypothetical protein
MATKQPKTKSSKPSAHGMTYMRLAPVVEPVQLAAPFDDVTVVMRVNPSMAQIQAVVSGEDRLQALVQVIESWNLGDLEGQPLPVSVAGLNQLPEDLIVAIAQAWTAARLARVQAQVDRTNGNGTA